MYAPPLPPAPQVDVLVGYGLTYSFPLDDDGEGSTSSGPRPAPLAPPIDTLHRYSALSHQPIARALGPSRGLKPGWSSQGVPLTLRQGLAQHITTAVITRLEQVSSTRGAWREGAPTQGIRREGGRAVSSSGTCVVEVVEEEWVGGSSWVL